MKRRLIYLLLVAVLALPMFGSLMPLLVPKASALTADEQSEKDIRGATLSWIDGGTIKAIVGSNNYFFKLKPKDGDLTSFFTYKIQEYSCFGAITLNPDDLGKSSGPTSVNLDMDYHHSDPDAANNGATDCVNVGGAGDSISRPIADPGNYGILFYQSKDGKSISSWDGANDWDFSQTTKYPDLYTRDSEKKCQDIIKVNTVNGTMQYYDLTDNFFKNEGDPPADIHANEGCKLAEHKDGYPNNGQSYKLGSVTDDSQAAGSGGTAGGGDTGELEGLGCEANENALSWVICPIVNLLVGFIGFIDSVITSQLNIQTGDIFCSAGDTCDAFHKSWRSFRNIALGLMVIAGLVMLIAQALGMEILDAYTIRKVLPRVLIAALGITLSWPLMNFFVQFTNDLGNGVRHLIYAPFSGLSDTIKFSNDAASVFFGGVAAGALPAAGAGAGAIIFTLGGGLGALVAYLGTAALAVLVAIVVIALRQIAVIMLILVAPLAIVAYILPNTQKIYKFWWESFSKALLMFPLIVAFIAAGRVFSAIAISHGGTLNQIIGFFAYFAPYFLIPLTFRFAGGVLAQLGGFVNDRSKGGFDRLRNFRQKRREAGFRRIQAGELYRNAPEGSKKWKLNRAYQAASLFNPDEISANPRHWRSEARALRERADTINAQKAVEDEAFLPIKGDDDTSHAAIKYGRYGRESARKFLEGITDADGNKVYSSDEIEQKLAHITQLRKKFGAPAFNQAAIMSAVMASTSYGADPETGEGGRIGELVSDIDWASGGNDQVRAQLIGQVKQRAQQAGRTDLVAPFTDMYMQSKIIGRAGSDAERRQAIDTASDTLIDKIIETEGPGFLFGAKGKAGENFIPGLQRRLKRTADASAQAHDVVSRVQGGETVTIQDENGQQVQLSGRAGLAEAERRAANADRAMKQTLASTAGLHDIAQQLSPEKAKLIADGVLGQNIPGFGKTVLETIQDFQGDDEFFEMRNDYNYRYARDPAVLQYAQTQAGQMGQILGGQGPGGLPRLPGQ